MRIKERSIAGLFNTRCINRFNAAPGILAILEGDFSQLPETPSHEDWQTLAQMIDGYELSEKLGLGELGDYLTKQCLPQYIESGRLPDKFIELWIFLFGMQRREKWSDRPLEGQEKKAVFDIYEKLRNKLSEPKGVCIRIPFLKGETTCEQTKLIIYP